MLHFIFSFSEVPTAKWKFSLYCSNSKNDKKQKIENIDPQRILLLPTIDHEEIIILGLYVESGVYMGHVVPSLRVYLVF